MLDSTHIKATYVGGALVATLKPEKVGEYEASVIEKELVDMLQQPGSKMALDLSPVQMISSVGLGLLISLNRHCRGKKGKLVLFGLTDAIKSILKMTRLDSGLTIVANQDAAVKALG